MEQKDEMDHGWFRPSNSVVLLRLAILALGRSQAAIDAADLMS